MSKKEDLIFIDETGVNLTMVRTYARAIEGQRAYGDRPDHHRDNITLIGAIGLSGWRECNDSQWWYKWRYFSIFLRVHFGSKFMGGSICCYG